MSKNQIIVHISANDRALSHIPNWVYDLARQPENEVYYLDLKTKKRVQVLDISNGREETVDMIVKEK